jgi:hypothetical protein
MLQRLSRTLTWSSEDQEGNKRKQERAPLLIVRNN